jgi:hypothetical protein
MPTINSCLPGLCHAHYSELSAAPLDTSVALAHQRDNRTGNRHGVKPRPRQRLNSQDYTMSNAIEKPTPTATVAGTGGRHFLWQWQMNKY